MIFNLFYTIKLFDVLSKQNLNMLILFMKVKNLMVAITMAPGLQIHQINFQKHTFLWQSCNVGDLYSNSNHVSVHIWPDMFQMFMREKSELSIFNTLYSTLKESFQNGSLKHWSNKVISKRIRRRKYVLWIDFDLSLQKT